MKKWFKDVTTIEELRKRYRELLGFTWCSKKKAWVWHNGQYRRHHKREIPLNDIRAKYGSQTVKNQSYQYSLQ